jgi:hypothetical protein
MQSMMNKWRRVIRRESNVIHVDFSGESDPPAPRFPGAAGMRADSAISELADTPFEPGIGSHIVSFSMTALPRYWLAVTR